jgi:hypothetical protein
MCRVAQRLVGVSVERLRGRESRLHRRIWFYGRPKHCQQIRFV